MPSANRKTLVPLGQLKRLEPDYRESRAPHFPSRYSIQHFVRTHKARLIKAGALVMHGGAWYAEEAAFDTVVVQVASERAQRIAAAIPQGNALIGGEVAK